MPASNELIFIIHSCFIALVTGAALRWGIAGLTALIAFYCVLANLFVLKQITLFGLTATPSDAFTIGATLGLNLLQEYYGKESAAKAIWINFSILIFFMLSCLLHLWYAPASIDTMHPHYAALLTPIPRIAIASLLVFLGAQYVDYFMYGLLKKTLPARWFIIRNYGSMLISQLFDTVFFSIFGLWGLVDNIAHIILISYSVKVVAIIIAVPFVRFTRFFMQSPPTCV